MFSLKLGLFLCIFYIIGMEAAPEPEPEDLHIHLNLQDTTGAAQEAAMDYGHAMWDDRKGWLLSKKLWNVLAQAVAL